MTVPETGRSKWFEEQGTAIELHAGEPASGTSAGRATIHFGCEPMSESGNLNDQLARSIDSAEAHQYGEPPGTF
jgi:hypothetical protein